MNGLITISDGAGTIIENGIVNANIININDSIITYDIDVNTIDAININSTYVNATTVTTNDTIINRNSSSGLVPFLGPILSIGEILQNMYFNNTTRLFNIFKDNATSLNDSILSINTSTGAVSFNSKLPTSSVTPNADNELITRIYADSRYGEIATQNNWTALNTFNSFLPRSTIGAATLDAQFVTKGIADGFYGRLAVANTFTQLNTFSLGIVPRRFAGNGTDYQISNNSMANRQTASVNNIGIGNDTLTGDTNALGYQYNIGTANLSWGHQSMQFLDSGSNNIGIGYQTLQNTGLSRVNGVGVTANRCIAIGNLSQKTSIFASDNISIGHNSFSNNVSGNGNVIIATNGGGGLSGKNGCVIIGRNSCPTASENSIISIGDGAMGAATGATLACIAIGESALYNARSSGSIGIGYRALYNLTTGFDCQAWGYQAGQNAITASFSQFIGRGADTNLSSVVNSVCMGYGAITTENFEFVVGGLGGGDYPRLTLPNKTRLACNQYPTGVTINLSFRTNENVQITDATTTINLPSPNSFNVGTKFYINRQVTGVSININAPSGQTIRINQVNGSSITLTPYIMNAGVNNLTLLCIGSTAGGANWLVIPPAISQGTDSLYISSSIGIPATQYSIPFGGQTTSDYYPMFMDNTNLKFQPSTGTLTTTKLNLTNKTNIQNTQSFGSVSTITLSFGSNEYVVINSVTTSIINLPQAIVATTIHVGACFNIVRTHLSTSNIVIVAFGTEKISWKGALYSSVSIDSWVLSISVVCVDNVAGNGVWTIKGYNDRVTLATDANKIQTLSDSSNVNYPMCFTTMSDGTGYNNVYGNSNLTYNPSTSILSASNITINELITNQVYKPFKSVLMYSNATVLPSLPTLFGLYLWAEANPQGAGDTIITLPQLQTYYDGCRITFRRLTHQVSPNSPRNLIIKTPSATFNGLNQLIKARDSTTTITSNTNYTLLNTTVSRLGVFATLQVSENVWYVVD
jgi:hypothetical protein